MTPSDPIIPDTKDWTWVLERPCPECGFDAPSIARESLALRIGGGAGLWTDLLRRPDVAERPEPGVWSPLEYACHVRDVHRIFAERLRQMLAEDDPQFANWDQDATAVADDYAAQDPAVVGPELVAAAEAVAAIYAEVPDEAWGRTGRRSDGAVFTIESLGRYHLHDAFHHVHDVTSRPPLEA